MPHLTRPSITLFTSICVLMLASCGRPSTTTASGEEQTETVKLRRAALTDIADHVIIAQYDEFVTRTDALIAATKAWEVNPESEENRDAARAAWREAMTSWQKSELAQIGPAGIMGEVAGGDDLRSLIYSWPLTNACRIDQELAKLAYDDDGYFPTQLVNVRGLDALEYVIFYDGEDNACAPNAPLNSGQDWSSLGAEELTARRAGFAHAASQDLGQSAKALHDAWKASGKDFRAELVNAGTSSQTYGSTQEALNALSDAMFYIEKETKDMKLAIPAGLTDCDTMTCPDALEHPYADFALEASLANHRAFERIYLGNVPGETERTGFDDLLREAGQDELDAEIQMLIAQAIAAHEAIDVPLSEALENDLPKVIALYEASQKLGTVLKTQFIGVLDLELPQRAEGDND